MTNELAWVVVVGGLALLSAGLALWNALQWRSLKSTLAMENLAAPLQAQLDRFASALREELQRSGSATRQELNQTLATLQQM
jgi:uncharacterized iron-regulated protein